MLLSSAIEAQSNVSLWDQLGKLFISTMDDHPSPLREAMEKMMEAHSSAELSGIGKALQRYTEMSNALYSASLQETAEKIREYQDSLYSPELREMMRSIKENQKRIMDAQRLPDLPRNEGASQESKDSQEEENDA